MWGRPADLINCVKILGNRFKGFDSAGSQNSTLPIDLKCHRYYSAVLHYRAAFDYTAR